MDISCDIIQDLLPLYAEDLTSGDSKKLVEEHLCGCDECTKQLGILKKAQAIPMDVEVNSLKRVEDTIRRRRILAVLTVLLFVITLAVSCDMLLDAKIYLTAEQAVQSVERRDNGDVVIYLNNNVMGMGATQHEDSKNYGTIAWSNLSRVLFPVERIRYEDLSAEYQLFYSEDEYEEVSRFILGNADGYSIWYCDAMSGKAETLLMDGGNPEQAKSLLVVNYSLAYYCGILAVMAVLLTIPGWRFREQWHGELCVRLSIVLGSLCLSEIIVCAGQFAQTYDVFTEHVAKSTIIALPMALCVLFTKQLCKLKKQEKGQ